MDVNGTYTRRFDVPAAFAVDGARWSERGEGVCLEPSQTLRLPPRDRDAALARLASSRATVVDPFETLGRVGAGDQLFIHGEFDEPLRDDNLALVEPPQGTFGHAHVGGESRLALAWTGIDGLGGVVVFDLSRRWQLCVALGFPTERVVIDRASNVWVAGGGSLVRLEGGPLPQPYIPRRDRFEPQVVNPEPLRVVWSSSPSVSYSGRVLGLAEDGERLFLLLDRDADRQHILARALDADVSTPWTEYALPGDDSPYATDLAVLERGRVVLFTAAVRDDGDEQRRDPLVVDLSGAPGDTSPSERIVRERWPMASVGSPRFISSLDRRVRYLDADGRACPLIPLPLPRYVGAGHVELGETLLDSGRVECVWHRLFVEATVPRACRITVEMRVSDTPDELFNDSPWVEQPTLIATSFRDERGASISLPPRAPRDPELFELLFQRPTGRSREMRGRYARIRLTLSGDGRHTPLVHAARVHFPRFSYQREYLPAHFRPQHIEDDADVPRDADGADFRERFFAVFEGLLTPLEGRIAAADRLLDPWTCPERALEWLADFRGLELDTSWPVERQRRRVAEAGRLASTRGTLAGLQLALDVATDGAVARGQVVVVENHRLRRTFATVLGVDLDDDEHPLTLGSMESGHAIVGDTLLLAEESARAFLALFDPALATSQEAAEIAAFFDAYAHRVTILVHGSAALFETQVRQTLATEIPAHVQWDLFSTDHPFVLGLAPLLAVDTWLERRPPPRRVVVGGTWLSREGLLLNPPALAPRLIGSGKPVSS